MKNISNSFLVAVFLAFVSQGIQAQFDDIYYDPNKIREKERIRYEEPVKVEEETTQPEFNRDDYDDDFGEWEDQDYYYSSRIKRFHRPYRGFDYYDPIYVSYYVYDPFDFDPWYYDRDIYMMGYGYRDYYRWRHWHNHHWNGYYHNHYWANRDWCYGWSSYPFSYNYSYWPGSWYSGYGGYYGGGYYGGYYGYNNPYYGGGGQYNDPNAKDRYYGSRHFGQTNTSNRGPVRVNNPSPRVILEAPGENVKPTTGPRPAPRKMDPDGLKPGPVITPERNPGRGTNPVPDRSVPEKTSPRKPETERKTPDTFKPERTAPRREVEPSRPNPERQPAEPKRETQPAEPKKKDPSPRRSNEEAGFEGKSFKPERSYREESAPRDSRPGMEPNRSRSNNSYDATRPSRQEPRQESFRSAPSRSQSSGSGSGGGGGNKSDGGSSRRSPR